MLLIRYRPVCLIREHPQNLAVEIVAHVLAAAHDIPHVQFQDCQELPEQLIRPHLVNKYQVSRLPQVCSIVVKALFLLVGGVLYPDAD